MKRIVKGNDFTLRIPVMKMVEGEKVAFPLPACTDVQVRVCTSFKRTELAFEVDAENDNVILARVEGDKIAIGTYAVEVKGKIFGNDWRSEEYPQFEIVSKNADADTEFGETDEGDNSVEMDSALVILPPSVDLSNLIGKAEEAISNTEKVIENIKATTSSMSASEEERVEAEKLRVANEKERAKAETERSDAELARVSAEGKRNSSEDARSSAEDARLKAEVEREKTKEACQTATDNANTAADNTNAAISACKTATEGAEKVNARLEGNVLTVTNRNGKEESVNLTDTDEHVTVNCTTTLTDTSVEGLVINVYVNNGSDPYQYTTDSNGQAAFTITKGSTYKVVFPYLKGANILDPKQYVAAVGNRIIDAEYVAETEKFERVTVQMRKADDDGNLVPWEGASVYVTISNVKTTYTTDADGKVQLDVKNGTSYTVAVDKIDGMYEQYNRYSITRTAIADSYRFNFIYRPYESGIWLVDDENKHWTYDDWIASGNDSQRLMFVCIKTLSTQRYNGDIYISLDNLMGFTKLAVLKTWCSQNAQFNNIPVNGQDTNNSSWSRFAYNGLLATETIIAEGDERELSTPACDYAYSFQIKNGELTYQGYLPTTYQWSTVWNNIDMIIDILGIKFPDMTFTRSMYSSNKWTSTQINATYSYYFNTSVLNNFKTSSYLAFPFFACLSAS